MAITTETIKALRDKTGISIMQCKKALEEAGGDTEKAIIILRKQGAATALKKGDRTLNAGVIASYVHSNSRVGAMIELGCETDFVSGNAEFKSLAYDIAMHIAASNPEYLKKEDVTEEMKQKAMDAFKKEVEGKPDDMKAKILEAKLASYLQDKVLLDQAFIKNPELTIADLINGAIQKFGEKTEIIRYVRFGLLEQ